MKFSTFFFLIIVLVGLFACTPARLEIPPTAAVLEFMVRQDSDTVVATAAAATVPEVDETAVVPPEDEQLPHITLPISVYIVDGEDDVFNSGRSEAEIRQIFEKANKIWAQAHIEISVQAVERITLPAEILTAIQSGNFTPFFDEVGVAFDVPNPSLLNGFYSQQIGGPNGIVPFSSRVFFITDTPSVHDERVTAHEIGHILGLHHVLDDSERLMYSGTNGILLSEEEIKVARYGAQGVLNHVR